MPTQLVITLEDNGQLNVNGPLDNLLMCYGMLSLAHDSIKDYAASKQNRVQLATPGSVPPLPKAGL